MSMGDMGVMPQEPMGDMSQPQMDDMPQEPMDDMPNGGDGFDADVNADENSDPKTYVQQLTGKLSQELRNYNNDQGNQDTELNKYVAGMIIPQATKHMTDDDKSEVIKKIKKGVTDDGESNSSEESMPMESRQIHDSLMNEIMNSIIDDKKKQRLEKQTTKKKSNPFVSNR